jgi:hypothetical protein
MSNLNTSSNNPDVEAFLASVDNESRVAECRELMAMMQEIVGEPPTLWRSSIIGFGSYHYVYESGREGEWFLTGCSPRKSALTLYIMAGFDRYEELMERLGTYRTGKSCLYLKRLGDVDGDVLAELIEASVAHMRAMHETSS